MLKAGIGPSPTSMDTIPRALAIVYGPDRLREREGMRIVYIRVKRFICRRSRFSA